MAYSVSSPSKASRNTRTSSRKAANDYNSAISGLSSSLSDLRKSLLDEQLAAIEYEIEIGGASVTDKIDLYEQYSSSLTEGTTEWYRVQTKLQNLKDSAATEDFSLAKSLYAGNQISTEQYYSILKERASEEGISSKESRQRLTDLWEFESKLGNQNTDAALRESLALEEAGVISASERLQLLQGIASKETDPERKQNIQYQIINQQKKVYEEDLSVRELKVRKGIQEGVNTKQDLLPIYAEKIMTATSNKDALQYEVNYQSLVKDIQEDYVANFNRNSKEIKSNVNGMIGELDRKIELAKKGGDITVLRLLYENKKDLIGMYMESDAVTLDDKKASSNMTNFLKDVYGMDIDVETGSRIDVTPTAQLNIQEVESALMNPDSSVLVKSDSLDGTTSTFKLVRGTAAQVVDPVTGEMKTFYDYGENVAITKFSPNSTRDAIDPVTGEKILDANGNPLQTPQLAVARSIQKIGDVELQAMKAANLKALPATEFKGEYIDYFKDQEGNNVRGYVVYGDKYANVDGAVPVPNKPGSYILVTKNNVAPTQNYVSENTTMRQGGFTDVALSAGAAVQRFIPQGFQDFSKNNLKAGLSGATGGKSDLAFAAYDLASGKNSFNGAGDVKGNIANMKLNLPDVSKTFNTIASSAGILGGLYSGVINAQKITTNLSASKPDYGATLQNAVNSAYKYGSQALSSVSDFFSKGLSYLGIGGK